MEKMKLIKNKKGFYPLYTALGLVVVLVVFSIAIQWNNQGDKDFLSHVDYISYLKIRHNVENIRETVVSSIRDEVYDSVMEIGTIRDGTINSYLEGSKDGGWKSIVDFLKNNSVSDVNRVISTIADYSDGYQSTFVFEDGVNVTIGYLKPNDLEIVEIDGSMGIVVTLPEVITNRYNGWEAQISRSNITIPLGIRLKDMYERAWEFHNSYEETVGWAVTLALYARAYMAAYQSKEKGAFLKVAHYDFDPVAALLFGDINIVTNIAKDPKSLLDIGAVPAATWYVEWQTLSEPSFLPPGIDLTSGEDERKAQDAISGNLNFVDLQEEVCGDVNLTPQQREDCKSLYDSDRLSDILDSTRRKLNDMEDVLEEIDEWLDKYDVEEYHSEYEDCREGRDDCRDRYERCEERERPDCDEDYDWCRKKHSRERCHLKAMDALFGNTNCDEFRDDATEIIATLTENLDDDLPDLIEEAREEYTNDLSDVDPRVEEKFEENENETGLSETENLIDGSKEAKEELADILETRLTESAINDQACEIDQPVNCEFDKDCERDEKCDVRCRGPDCPSGNSNYECLGNHEVGRRTYTCRIRDDEGDWEDVSVSIDQCDCQCRPSLGFLGDINEGFEDIRAAVEQTVRTLEMQVENLQKQLESQQKSEEFKELVEGLNAQVEGYDIISRIDPSYVKFDTGLDGWKQYIPGDYWQKDEGVCGDSAESAVLYTAQIAAAMLASFFTAGVASPLVAYAKDFFPVIIESEVSFNLTESIIDDSSRIILTNLGSSGGRLGGMGDPQLYTYAPFEFKIYKNRHFNTGATSFNRVVVYVYLPAVKGGGLKRVLEGLSSCGNAINCES